jgi:hypothetical protein
MPCSERLTHVLPNLRAMRPLFFDLNTAGLQLLANLQGMPEEYQQFADYMEKLDWLRRGLNDAIDWIEHGCPDAGG